MVLSKSNMARAQTYNLELKLEWIWGKCYNYSDEETAVNIQL